MLQGVRGHSIHATHFSSMQLPVANRNVLVMINCNISMSTNLQIYEIVNGTCEFIWDYTSQQYLEIVILRAAQ